MARVRTGGGVAIPNGTSISTTTTDLASIPPVVMGDELGGFTTTLEPAKALETIAQLNKPSMDEAAKKTDAYVKEMLERQEKAKIDVQRKKDFEALQEKIHIRQLEETKELTEKELYIAKLMKEKAEKALEKAWQSTMFEVVRAEEMYGKPNSFSSYRVGPFRASGTTLPGETIAQGTKRVLDELAEVAKAERARMHEEFTAHWDQHFGRK